MQKLKDAGVLLVLLILLISVRVTPTSGSADMVPTTEAATPARSVPAAAGVAVSRSEPAVSSELKASTIQESAQCPLLHRSRQLHGENGSFIMIEVDRDVEVGSGAATRDQRGSIRVKRVARTSC